MAYNHEFDSFYQGEKWKRTRARILRRDKYQCQLCRRYGRMREATEVHHIIHLDEDMTKAYDAKNLISLCHACHNLQHPEKTKHLNTARERYQY